MKFLCIFVCLASNLYLSKSEDIIVIRKAVEKTKQVQDRFILPSLHCVKGVPDCNKFEAKPLYNERKKKCQCVCDRDQRNVSTFALGNKQKCMNDKELKISIGFDCSFKIAPDGKSSSGILTVPLRGKFRWHEPANEFKFLSGCKIHYPKSRFRDCSGMWRPLDRDMQRFRLTTDLSFSSNGFQGVVTTNFSQEGKGRLVKLGIRCKTVFNSVDNCVLLKLPGEMKCPVSSVQTKKHLPIPTANFNPTPLQTFASTFPHTTAFLKTNGQREDNFSTTAIAGIATSGVLLIFFAILGIHCKNKRKKTKRHVAEVHRNIVLVNENPNSGVTTSPRENVTVATGRNQNEENEGYQEIDLAASSAYTNLTRPNQITSGTTASPVESLLTEGYGSGTRNSINYQDLLKHVQPYYVPYYEPLRHTSERNNVGFIKGKGQTLSHQSESPLNDAEDYEHMELRVHNAEQPSQLEEKHEYENCNNSYYNF